MPRLNVQPAKAMQYRLALFVCLLALCVVLMGAYVRLSDAGLGCPDWPGCYGQLIVPTGMTAEDDASDLYAQRPLVSSKAWKEMIHRYLAGSLGLAIVLLAILAWRNRKQNNQPLLLPSLLVLLVLFQAALGMWTVTLKVKPAIVTAHLLGGFATLALLWLYALKLKTTTRPHARDPNHSNLLTWLGLLVLILQITLGGWTSSNYAALGCVEFPTCYAGQWWPAMDFREAFVLWRGIGINYEFGVLSGEARTAIHVTHRLGALLTALVLGMLAFHLIRHQAYPTYRKLGMLLLGLLIAQISLGISNVLGHLPLPVAVAHNGVAALLLLAIVTILWFSRDDAGSSHGTNDQ